jgi:purine-binding chemotaxis protein CheW
VESQASLYCTFFLGSTRFGVPAERVQEVLRGRDPTAVPLAPAAVRGVINLRGRIVAVVDLRRQFGLPERPAGDPGMHVVVRTRDELVSLLVDRPGDVVEVPERTCEEPPETVQGRWRELVRSVCHDEQDLLLLLDLERAAHCTVRG